MKICGLQKLTLLDYPGKVACTVFLGGCNFRCQWCHNSSLTDKNAHEIMNSQDLLTFLDNRKDKLEGVAITGGEPCLNDDLPDLLEEIKQIGYKVKLDTNGSRYDMLKDVINKGLVDYIAMDIKNRMAKYDKTINAYTHDYMFDVMQSVKMLLHSGIEYEFRTTVIDELHDIEDFKYIGQWICGAKRYYMQPFKDSESVVYKGYHAPNDDKLNECLNMVRRYVESAEIRGK